MPERSSKKKSPKGATWSDGVVDVAPLGLFYRVMPLTTGLRPWLYDFGPSGAFSIFTKIQ
jgi:hypothetical protein